MRRRIGTVGAAALLLVLAIASVLQVSERARGATVDYITIVDAPGGMGSWVSGRDYMFGDTDTFWAAGYNISQGWVADVFVDWTYDNPFGDAAVVRANVSFGPSVRIDTNGYGVAKLGARLGILQNTTGPLRVSVDNVDSVVVRSDRGGMGSWVGPTTYFLWDQDTFYAAAYDATQAFLGDINANWTSSDPPVGYVQSSIWGCNRTGGATCYPYATFTAQVVGFTYVNATPVGTALTNTTGKLTVTTVTVDYVQIRDAPGGNGSVVGDRTYYVREQDTFYAASYNFTFLFRGDVSADWATNDSAVCEVGLGGVTHGSSVQILMKSPGACTITVSFEALTNATGTLTVKERTLVTVDDSGGADFTKIQDAVDFALDGYTIYVYAGTYPEHVAVRKEIEIEGESVQDASHQTVVLDGGGTGTALFVGADRVVVHNLTIQNAGYGVYQDGTNNTRLYDSVVQDYQTGLYHDQTLNAWVAHNLITRGQFGVVAYKAYDDAIRYNEISYNTQYGGKGYDAHLRNCFNWNYLHNNHVGYFYDPTRDLPPMEFDGNVIADNDVGVKVENSSAITLTNNTITGGSEGVQLLNSSSEVRANSLANVGIGVQFLASASNIAGNTIVATSVGIVGDGGAPRIEGNDITMASGEAMVLSNLDRAVIQGNDVHGGTILILDSRISVLSLVNSVVILQDTTVDSLSLDAVSRVEVRWTVRVSVVDANGGGLGGASVTVRDARANLAFSGATGPDGFTPPIILTTEVRNGSFVEDRNPFTFDVSYGSARATLTVTVSGAGDITIPVSIGIPIGLVAALAAAVLVSVSLAGVFTVERSRYAFFAFLMPLYSRLSRDKALENYNRGRVYEYVELNPGVHFHGILAALDMNNGSLVYHLEVLQREGLVTSRQEGMYRRFFPKGVDLPPVPENGTTPAQQIVLKVIGEMPGITQKQLSRFLGLPRSTLAYQIDKLSAAGLIVSEKRGRKVHYTAKRGGT